MIKFLDNDGRFRVMNPHRETYLYFPLANEEGMMCSISPLLRGDIKKGQHCFFLTPVSAEELHTSVSGRNFWVLCDKGIIWSACGNAAHQRALLFSDNEENEKVTLEAGFLWHRIMRENVKIGIRATITNFVPHGGGYRECMEVILTNIRSTDMEITPTAAIPIYGRSADNIRDHRHVTSILHRIRTTAYGVTVTPTLLFDERGHHMNTTSYTVSGIDDDGNPPTGYFPLVEDFIGCGGSLDWPRAVVNNVTPRAGPGEIYEGCEAIGALRFQTVLLHKGQSLSYRIVMAINPHENENQNMKGKDTRWLSKKHFQAVFKLTETYWSNKSRVPEFNTQNSHFGKWMKWVTIQPVLRNIFGCSFLPHHDYGRGGRGWRDLWQDCLALLLTEPETVRSVLLSNFAGVRFDGSNATIIGRKPNEFLADRSNIPRVWMDHGVWPFLATKLYIDQTGDSAFLFEEQTYFRDMHIMRCRARDEQWNPGCGFIQKNEDGSPYRATVLEHILIQHLTSFFNVGEHNIIRLENADWNDGLDMAVERGESVAFSALYGTNLVGIADLLRTISDRMGIMAVNLSPHLLILLDTLSGNNVDYHLPEEKKKTLQDFLHIVTQTLSSKTVSISIDELAADCEKKGRHILSHIRENEWITNSNGYGWFNGYYDNNGHRVEGDHDKGVRMTLTGQVFAIMGRAATDRQVREIIRAVDHYLWKDSMGGPRLNTNFHDILLNLGRCFAFAYGHKENGAMFCHMAVMYAHALYSRGYVLEGFRVLDTIFRHTIDFSRSRIYPGIPEYFDQSGRGMYHYLTGSASWYLYTVLTKMFGVRGKMGDLLIVPRLTKNQFDEKKEATVITVFAGRRLRIVYRNPDNLEYDMYRVDSILIEKNAVDFDREENGALIKRSVIGALHPEREHMIVVSLKAL
jgi:cellobiose phosphorylase